MNFIAFNEHKCSKKNNYMDQIYTNERENMNHTSWEQWKCKTAILAGIDVEWPQAKQQQTDTSIDDMWLQGQATEKEIEMWHHHTALTQTVRMIDTSLTNDEYKEKEGRE